MRLTRLLPAFGLAIALCFSSLSHAQAVYGSIYGTVTDPSGAVVPNAKVTITDVSKNTSTSVTSNASGGYVAEHLIPDTYNVKVEASGFQAFEATGIAVAADTSPRIDAQLKTGSASTTITVSASEIPELKTDRADVATEFTTREVEDLPIPDRNFTNMQLLLPGAQSLNWSHAADENPQASKQINVDGQAFGGVAYQLDGTDNQDPILGIIVVNPPLDAISESKITTQNYDAEFGKAVSSFISVQTKSGSNHFHGSAFDYRESNANLGRDPYTQFPGTIFPPGLKNQFGGSIGGPILKDKLFFFGDYQGVRQKVGTAATATVPSAHLVATCLGTATPSNGIPGCDFSEYAAAAGETQLVYQQAPTGPNGTTVSTPYPGNVIPAGQLSGQALAFMKLLAPYAPNSGGSYSGLKDNYSTSGTGLFNNNQWDVRVDDQLTSGMHAFTRFSRFTDTLSGSTMFGAAGGPGFGIGGYGGVSTGANDSLAAGMDIAVNQKLLMDWRIGYYRYNIIDHKYDQSTEFANQLGIPGLNLGDSFTSGAPGFNVADADVRAPNGPSGNTANPTGGGAQYGSGLNINRCNCPLTEREDQFQIVNNWTRISGNHSLKFGVDLRYARNLRVPSDNDRTGLLDFAPGPTSNGSGGGLGWASLMLGDVSSFNRYVSVSTNAKEFQKRDFFYAQDTWHPTPSLTVNYGLRYEMYFPESVNAKGNGSLMEMNDGAGGYKTDGYLRVAGYGGIPSNMGWSAITNAWNPRLGIAWSPDAKTVVRAGYGRSFDMGVFGSIFGHTVTQNLPVLANQSLTAATTTDSAFTLANGPVKYQFPTVPASGLLPAPEYGVQVKARPNSLRMPTLDAWNLSVQRALTPTLSLTVAYVANKGTHTLSDGDGNSTNPNEAGIVLPAEYSVTGSALHYDPSVPTDVVPLGGQAIGIAADGGTKVSNFLQRFYGAGLSACTDPSYEAALAGQNEANIKPGMCGWTQSIQFNGDDQNTNFNSLDITLAKQYTHGLSGNLQYAWQRAFDYSGTYATWSKRAAYGPDSNLRSQQLVAYGIYALPFGRNQMFASNDTKLEDEIIGGWQLSPVLTWSNGLPWSLGLGSGCGASLPGSAPCYPVGKRSALHTSLSGFDAQTHQRTFFKAANTTSFTEAPLDTIGNVGRNGFIGPGYFNTDMSLQKNFPIRETLTAQFRMDAYNVFNHINPGNPGQTNTGSDGTITGEPALGIYTNPRQLQFSLRVQF
ncbi:MAG TPA: TonB-dependent receptor [Acidobacteriaceae bacterium]